MEIVIKYKKIKFNVLDFIALLLLLMSMLRPFAPTGIRPLFFIFKAISMGIVFIYSMLIKRSKKSIIPILFFAFSIFFSSIYNHRSIENKLISLSDAFLFINMFLLLDNMVCKYNLSDIIICLKRVLIVYLIITDISTFFTPISNNAFYFIGTKFVVSYLHIFYLTLTMYKIPELNKGVPIFKVILFYFYSLFIICRIGCSTGLVGLTIAFLLGLFIRKKETILAPKNILIIILVSFIIFINLSVMLNFQPIQNVIVNILGEDLSLTGRIQIYEKLNLVIKNNFLFGYGFENTAVANLVGYGNAQNGIYEIIVNYGIFGLVSFIICVFMSCRKVKYTTNIIKPFNIMLVVLSIISIIEISFNYYYIFSLAMIFAIKNNDKLETGGE